MMETSCFGAILQYFQSTRTPYLQLSNLEEGVYRFQLKVSDMVGQSSTAEVDVFVKPQANSELRGIIRLFFHSFIIVFNGILFMF